jgi:regulatory protein
VINHKVTALKAQKRNRQRINVYLDGEYAFGLARIVAAWLYIGQEISDDKIAQLLDDDARESAYQRALRFMDYRPRTEQEIRQKLAEQAVSEEVAATVIERLKDNGLIDDARFARMWVDNRSELHPRSQRYLRFELQRRGVDPQEIEEALEAVDNEAMAYRAATKQARKYKDLDRRVFRQKLTNYLAQRGFNYDTCTQVIPRVWDELHGENPSPNEEAQT